MDWRHVKARTILDKSKQVDIRTKESEKSAIHHGPSSAPLVLLSPTQYTQGSLDGAARLWWRS